MCMSCSFGSPNDDHGDRRNITLNDLDQAAQAAGTSVAQVTQNIMTGWNQLSAGASGEQGLGGSSSQQDTSSQSLGQRTGTNER